MKCLNCRLEMVEKVEQTPRGLVYYDVCEACGGIWFDRGEMDAMVVQWYPSVEDASRENSRNVPEATRKCPRCEDRMLDKVVFMKFSRIVLDHCRQCGGFWLDGGELDLINQDLSNLKGHALPEPDLSFPHDRLWLIPGLLDLLFN